MGKKAKLTIPEDKLQAYHQLVESIPEIALNSGFGFPYTSLNGHMFSFIAKTGSAGIRLPKIEREAFLKKFDTILFENHKGPILKEYVQISDDLLHKTEELIPYLQLALDYVKGLKPKPAKKKK